MVNVPVLSVAMILSRETEMTELKWRDIQIRTDTVLNVSTVAKLLTSTFWLYIRLATIVNTRVTEAGKPSGIKATTIPIELTILPMWKKKN